MENININMRSWPIERPIIKNSTKSDTWIRFDYDNNYPQRVIDLVNNSPLQKAIIESKISYMIGAGQKDGEKIYTDPNLYDSWFSLFEKLVIDYCYLGAFAVQVILNKSGNKFSFYHQPVDQIRFGQYNDKNIIEKAYICADWTKANKNKNVKEIKMFGSEQPKQGEAYLMYFKQNRAGEYYYAIPNYMSAANYIAADGSLARYYKAFIDNNFNANISIRFPEEPSEDKKEALFNSIAKSFQGSDNAGQVLLLFGENGVVPEVSPINSTGADVYNSVVDVIKLAIVSANRLTSPILAGISTSSGFSSKSDEMIAASVQYLLTVITPERKFIVKAINDMIEMNGEERNFNVNDFDVRSEFEGVTENNDVKEQEGIKNE